MKTKLILVLFLISLMLSIPRTAQASLGDGLLKAGSRGSDVIELQTKLNQLGYNVGSADGIFGNLTKQGVTNFQKVHSLAVDGIVGPNTVKALNTAYAELPSQPQINTILTTAKQYLGVNYQWGGSVPETGFDCSGFVAYVFKQNGISLPRVSRDQYTVGTKISFENLQPGDLVFFSFAGNGIVDHVGIYLGDGQFINASSSKGVTIYTMGSYWKSLYVGARRVL